MSPIPQGHASRVPQSCAQAQSSHAAATEQVTRKVSRHLLGFLFLLFVVSFLDRINIGFAGLTMMKDLGLSSTQFGFATTLFYVAYIACGIPGNLMLARVGARRWISFIMIAWGLASTATMFASNATTLYWLRMLVGVTEAGFLPGMLLYLTCWFPSAWRARANALFMIAMPVTAALGSAVSGYILKLDGHAGLAGWQWLFVLEGMPAALLGCVAFFYLDDTPRAARWLSAEEKSTLEAALAEPGEMHAMHAAHTTPGTQPTQPPGLWQQLRSPVVLRFAAAYFCLVNTLAMVAVWAPLIVKGFSAGASNVTVGLVATIPQLVTIVAMIAWGRRSDRLQERKWHLAAPMLLSGLGCVLTAQGGAPLVQLLGVCLASAGSYTAMSIFWTTPDQAFTPQARAIGIAVINAIGNISSAANPLVVGWLKDATHSYAAGLIYSAVLLVLGAVIVATLPLGREKEVKAVPRAAG
ncbi:MFS transporter [Paraburkholderia unamae]|uniref:ACS family 4-hydroxyphenylacetate permease-like MFS transporter n=1 Tax=Paraburkholderia unamae TaxID=219649 RepID=A0ABX5KAB0_9BURK|nr:MFS transporter [Paraburkholderia unamae]PVX71977.1 ACS family 4-hydroxyphenylacetate permease-like MFS transporter [Paraburkholderia unamae]